MVATVKTGGVYKNYKMYSGQNQLPEIVSKI